MTKLQPVKGMKDIIFDEYDRFEFLNNRAKDISKLYGFTGISTPILEYADVFNRNLGSTSDIVSKETYVLQDRNNDNLVMRPEFTAGVVRALISNGLTQKLPLKLFTNGQAFRYERPQKGRQRQFHQLDFECFGIESYLADAEMINFACHFLQDIGVLERSVLEINSLGSNESRMSYRQKLVSYLEKYENDLSEDSKRRLTKNPLRILDSKDSGDRKILIDAPKLSESYDKISQEFFDNLLQALNDFNIKYEINDKLVRGMDYYCHTAFEFVTEELGAQGTIAAGGRYDGLVKMMGGPDVPAVGFAAGAERLMEMIDFQKTPELSVAVVPVAQEFQQNAIMLTNMLRKNSIKSHLDYGSSNMSKRLKKANNAGCSFAVFVNEDLEKFSVKNMNSDVQEDVSKSNLIKYLGEFNVI